MAGWHCAGRPACHVWPSSPRESSAAKPGRPPYDELARRLSLDPGKFAACRGDGRQAANVRADAELARSHGLTGTPSFIVGRLVDGEFQGETIEGAQPYAAFAARIDALLEAAR